MWETLHSLIFFSGISPQAGPVSPGSALERAATHMQKKVILENPLHWLQEIGPQRQGVSQGFLTLPEELSQNLVSHALSQHCHGSAGKANILIQVAMHICEYSRHF